MRASEHVGAVIVALAISAQVEGQLPGFRYSNNDSIQVHCTYVGRSEVGGCVVSGGTTPLYHLDRNVPLSDSTANYAIATAPLATGTDVLVAGCGHGGFDVQAETQGTSALGYTVTAARNAIAFSGDLSSSMRAWVELETCGQLSTSAASSIDIQTMDVTFPLRVEVTGTLYLVRADLAGFWTVADGEGQLWTEVNGWSLTSDIRGPYTYINSDEIAELAATVPCDWGVRSATITPGDYLFTAHFRAVADAAENANGVCQNPAGVPAPVINQSGAILTVFVRYYPNGVCVGDANFDGTVNEADLALVLAGFGSDVGDLNYNPDADLDGDGDVDEGDLAVLLANWGVNC